MGRNAQPIDILKARGKKHLTKQEIQERKESEIKLGEQKLTCPAYVKNDVVAYAKWKEIIKLYKDIDWVSSGDVGLLGRYCMTHAEYMRLVDHRNKIDNIDYLTSDEEKTISDRIGEDEVNELFRKINFIISVDGVLKLDTAINKKQDMLIKMEDRLFLNPLAKIKNIPKKEKKPERDQNAELFD